VVVAVRRVAVTVLSVVRVVVVLSAGRHVMRAKQERAEDSEHNGGELSHDGLLVCGRCCPAALVLLGLKALYLLKQ